MEKPKEEKQEKKHIGHHIKKQLTKKINLPLYIILAVIVIIAISIFLKYPYKAKERYTEFENYVVEVQDVEKDTTPSYVRQCDDVPSVATISNYFVYGKPFGLNGYKCYAEFKVTNENSSDGKWTYRYVFNISGKEVITDPITEMIPKWNKIQYNFETNCLADDKVDGHYELVSSPTTPICKNVETYLNKTITRNETKQREVVKERIITKYESLWQKILGMNNKEKV
jgi:hypothetical protein